MLWCLWFIFEFIVFFDVSLSNYILPCDPSNSWHPIAFCRWRTTLLEGGCYQRHKPFYACWNVRCMKVHHVCHRCAKVMYEIAYKTKKKLFNCNPFLLRFGRWITKQRKLNDNTNLTGFLLQSFLFYVHSIHKLHTAIQL